MQFHCETEGMDREMQMSSRIRKTGLLTLAALAFFMTSARSADSAPRPFKDGDRVCFVGDSITHGGSYHSYITLFYTTRFPDRKVETFNCGISGDSATGAVHRFDWDIAPHSPTVATIMLGMNDVNRGLYGKENPDEQNLARRQAALDGHVASMRKLAEQLQAAKAEIVFITPSIYDQTSTMATENLFGVNDALGICAEKARVLAAEFGGSVVDFHGEMGRINAEYQKADPVRTIVGGDRVHPGPLGHLVMAYVFLKAQNLSPEVSRTVIDAAAGKLTESRNVEVTDLTATTDGVRFASLEGALPFPIPKGAEKALDLVPFMQDLNQEVLSVCGLRNGTYVLTIDDVAVGEYTADDLAKGINLAANTETPQYIQAKIVADANDKRHGLIAHKLRSFVKTEIYLRSRKDLDLDDFEAVKAALNARVEKMRETGSKYTKYYEGQTKLYIQEKIKDAEYVRQAEEAAKLMTTSNHPVRHQFVLVRKEK